MDLIGRKIWFLDEVKPYIIKAYSNRYIICTKPYNPQRTVLYTIIDWVRNIRGPHNLVFNSYNFKNKKDILLCMKNLIDEKIEVSYLRCRSLDIKKIDKISM